MAMLYADDHQIIDSSGSDGFVGVVVQVRGLVMAPGVCQLMSLHHKGWKIRLLQIP